MTVWDELRASRTAGGVERQMSSREVAHAWLLLGPAGSGKGAVAMAMAAALNCSDQPGVGCGTCRTCERIGRGRHPDVHHVVPEGPLIPVDVVRESIIPEAARSPFEGRYKVFVIEEAERMNPAAQNALLKTLEEPQEDTVFVLLSEREEELLETIRSRCRVVRLEPVSQRRLVELLVSDGVDHPDALLAARLSEGDLGRARALACDGEVRARRALWSSIPGRLTTPVASLEAAGAIVEAARAAVKERERAQKIEVAELAEALGEGRGTSVARNALAKRHKRELRRVEEQVLGEALGFLGSFYRDVVALRAGGDEAVTHLDLVAELGAWAASETPDAGFIRAAERCIEARTSLVRNANPALAIEAALVEVSSLAEPRAPWPAAPPG